MQVEVKITVKGDGEKLAKRKITQGVADLPEAMHLEKLAELAVRDIARELQERVL